MEPPDKIRDGSTLPIHLYAEHLQNIRTLSVQASLATASNKETKATLSADRDSLTLSHEGRSATIQLPVSLGHSDAILTIPASPNKDLSFRLTVEEKPGAVGVLGDSTQTSDVIIPWMASDLAPKTGISCAKCGEPLMTGNVQQWKDLPSEGWADMMDFWHCHKPDVPHDDDHGADNAGRGFAANSKLVAQEGAGLVGPTDFLFATSNCSGVQVGKILVFASLCQSLGYLS